MFTLASPSPSVAEDLGSPSNETVVEAAVAEAPAVASGFAALGIAGPLLTALARLAIATPTPVQSQTIPLLLAGRDVIASAPTGTGKTAAFMLPALQKIATSTAKRGRGPRVLVLAPTRELAQQVTRATQDFSRTLRQLTTVCVTGGESYHVQNRALSAPYEVLVATPGRLIDQMRTKRIDLSRVEVLVLDEADRMLDMGFAEDVSAIAAATPAGRQTVCFTATLSPAIRGLASQLLHDPEWLQVERKVEEMAPIDDHVLYVDGPEHRQRLLEALLNDSGMGQAIVFTATKRHADELSIELHRKGIAAQAIHGDLNQRERTRALNRLRRGECKVLVATDVAARGIDVSSVTHVINFSLPKVAEDYVHRIGRTGRAGASGQALSFVGREDLFNLHRIEHVIGRKVQVSEMAGHEPQFKPSDRKPRPKHKPGARPGGGKSFARKPYAGKARAGGAPRSAKHA
ncbi:MAG: DEAD/DEAH box helicase [Lautropia sp.]